ncbi:MAG: hypothetical protein JSU72_15755 [Deltaproteobacteria bacterium]|nr:MAG: hypothetical protein JSU72_15755 [Deltaproteobacteria bacterium]
MDTTRPLCYQVDWRFALPRGDDAQMAYPEVVWVVEARQINGLWKPVRVPQEKPFTQRQAKRCMKALLAEFPFLSKRNWPLRVVPYERSVLSWHE